MKSAIVAAIVAFCTAANATPFYTYTYESLLQPANSDTFGPFGLDFTFGYAGNANLLNGPQDLTTVLMPETPAESFFGTATFANGLVTNWNFFGFLDVNIVFFSSLAAGDSVESGISAWANPTGGGWSVSPALTATPLPAALPLFIAGLAGMGWLGRRRHARTSDCKTFFQSCSAF